jgi:pyrroloquinoline quinone biosynthesis protein E
VNIENLIIEVTQACNHSCLHCYNFWSEDRLPVKTQGTLSRAEINKIVHDIQLTSPLKAVALSGGEPFLRKDLAGIANDLADKGLKVVIITNGTMITDERLQSFPEATLFEITLFSSDSKIHDHIAQRPGAFNRVINGAIAVKKRNSGLAIVCVMSRENLQKLDQTIELALALGADGIALNRVNLSAQNIRFSQQLVPQVGELTEALNLAEQTAGKYGITLALSVPIPPCIAEPANYEHIQFGWCPRGGKNSYYTIGYNGLVRPCNHSSLILGDIRKDSLLKIVQAAKAEILWSAFPQECKLCPHDLRDYCKGGCPAASYECYKTSEKIDPFVNLCYNIKTPDFKH